MGHELVSGNYLILLFHPWDLLVINITRRLHILEMWNPPPICAVYGLMKDPYPRIAHRKTKARTPLVSHQRDNATRDPSYLTQYVQGWDHRHLVRIGHIQPRPERHILVPQPYLSHEAIPYTNRYDNRLLDDMLSTPFSSRIVNYEPPRGFLVPKFSMYDGSSNPFDHIMHYKKLMTLDIGNDGLLCKLLLMIRELSDFRWPEPLKADPAKRDHNRKSASVREHVSSIRPGLASESAHLIDGTIFFPPVDPIRILQPHRDALILALGIGDFDVRRFWSTRQLDADLLQVSVIKQMGFMPSSLENLGRILSRFNRASTTSLGDVVLPVQAGPVTLNMQFSVLHSMKAIPSTYHQMVSFLTKDGQIDLYAREVGSSNDHEPLPKKANAPDQ
ncbi:hypothetical protein AAG906_035102 [Vitis piasezkii]